MISKGKGEGGFAFLCLVFLHFFFIMVGGSHFCLLVLITKSFHRSAEISILPLVDEHHQRCLKFGLWGRWQQEEQPLNEGAIAIEVEQLLPLKIIQGKFVVNYKMKSAE